MQLYRFSPITSHDTLMEAIKHIHTECHKLCEQAIGTYLPNTGSLGIFTHYPEEFAYLKELQKTLTSAENPFNGKYFKLIEPITIPAQDQIPEATYTHLYIRQPDPYRAQVGDIDFYSPIEEFNTLKQRTSEGLIPGARVYPGANLDMIELYNFDSDVLAYIDTYNLK